MDPAAVTVEDLERDPFPIYKALRAHAPVAYMPCLDAWMLTRWSDVESACEDPVRFPAKVGRSPTDRALGGISMMTIDGDPAKRRRRPFDATFRPRAVEARMPTIFARLCAERLEAIARDGRADLVHDYFEPISVQSLAEAMGLDDTVEGSTLTRWFAGLAAGVSNYEDDPLKTAQCAAVSEEIETTIRPLFEARLGAPDGGLISDLVRAGEGPLEARIQFAMPSLKLVLLGGLQEPAHGGATVAACLLADPAQLAEVRSDPGLVPAAIEEGLRWTAPIGNLLRSVAPGTELGAMTVPPDSRALLVVSSANRDERVWGPTADRFDIRRPGRPHLAFATGPHYCIGHYFARTQLAVALRLLVDRFPRLRADPEHEIIYRGHEYRSPKAVRVLVD